MPVVEPLLRKFSLYAIDLMGHGNSDKPNKNYEIYYYGDSVTELLDVVGISKARVIGNSIGAVTSLEMPACFPRTVVKQVLLRRPAWEATREREERLMFFTLKYDTECDPKPITMDDLSLSYARPITQILERVNSLRAKAEL